ncbi:uncharacterized protein HMPREF1541_05169 [Cyphellophora europaea CBS 101466]|uniref:Pumilio homology domain family member 3 n=1 Tax=Cyphellophora europaea (strain CBS 101466) TaxID=1220924 RepID=W2RYZ9_CYPE1|nr:uncharacterized protein HMPREF1541_05169 [Cyphellophora europaea CBS 101466]ETN40889.1 hypothetical protein HMPREF1541_05169 [Cyphellophora europaea CBS 101466]
MASTFDRTLSVPKFDKFESGKSVWDTHRSIWQDDAADTDTSRRMKVILPFGKRNSHSPATSVRHNSASSSKFSKAVNGSALSTIDNPRNSSADSTAWNTSNGHAVQNRTDNPFISPTKRKQSGWLFDSKTYDIENSSRLLADSAPEFESLDGSNHHEKLVPGRSLRFSDEAASYDTRFAPSLRPTGPSQLPAPNRMLANGAVQGTQTNLRGNNGLASVHDFRPRSDVGQSMDTSPSANRGMGTGSARSSSSTVSPTTSRFARQMNGYLDRTAGNVDDTVEALRGLGFTKASPVYDKFGHMYDGVRSSVHPDDDFSQHNTGYDNGAYYRAGSYYEQEFVDSHNASTWPYWIPNDGKLRPEYISEYRNVPNSPYYSSSMTPSSGSDSIRSALASRNSQHEMTVTNRKPSNQDTYYQPAYMSGNVIIPNGAIPLDMAVRSHGMQMNPLATPYYVPGYISGPRHPFPREDQRSVVQRSPLLEEFRMNKSNKRYDLRDIFGHIVEFSGDQHGSRFIQQKLETANSDEKDQVFKEIQAEAMQLMTDVFGNYVIQKIFEHGNQSQKKILADYMKGRVAYLSMQMYGCRVVQKAFEHVLTDQQASMVKELDGPNKHVLKVIRDQNGNHVVQKAIERVPAEHIQFIIEAHKGEVVKLAQHTYGCRVIQRILEHCTPASKRVILDELHGCIAPLITDAFGNYVVQHVVQNGEPDDRRRVVSIVLQQLLVFSKHKFASNVVEKCLEHADDDQQSMLFTRLIHPDASGQTPVFGLLRDQYGNYVIQKVFGMLEGQQRAMLESEMRACFLQLKRTSYGKQVIAIEKLLYGNTQEGGHPIGMVMANGSHCHSSQMVPHQAVHAGHR